MQETNKDIMKKKKNTADWKIGIFLMGWCLHNCCGKGVRRVGVRVSGCVIEKVWW